MRCFFFLQFNIHCSDSYKLAFIGSIGNLARFLFLPVSGVLSDKYGRLSGIVWGTQLSFIFAMIKSYSINYTMYAVVRQIEKIKFNLKPSTIHHSFALFQFEFLEASTFTFCFSGIYLFAIELLGAKYRVLGNALMGTAFSMGGMLVGLVAMYVHNFRDVIRIFSAPGLLIFLYFWLVPESVRWLLATGRIDRAIETLKHIAKFNRREFTEKSITAIKLKYSPPSSITRRDSFKLDLNAEGNQSIFQLLRTLLTTKRLCLRFLSCTYQWAACCFSYYGLSQSSIQITGANRYISFIIVTGIEIPSGLLSQPLLNVMKRRILLCCTFLLAAVSIIATTFIPESYSWAVLLCFVVGKGSINLAFVTMYMYTSEQFSTDIRNTILNTCSMVGRVGSIVAPWVVLVNIFCYEQELTIFLLIPKDFIFALSICRVLNSVVRFNLYYLVDQLFWLLFYSFLIRKHI